MSVLGEQDLKDLFLETEALLLGHFQLSSGLHSGQYFQCARLLCDPDWAERLGAALAESAPPEWRDAKTVVAPALGGILIGHETARALRKRSLFAERKDGVMSLRRGFSVEPGERVLVVEDVITTGKSTGEVVSLLKSLGAEPVGALAIVLRAEGAPALGVPVRALAHWPAVSYAPADCPLCRQGLPIDKPGSRPG